MTDKEIVNKDESVAYIKKHWHISSNSEMAAALGIGLQTLRDKCYQLGLYRMILEYWNEEQIKFLIDNYEECGDKELAKIFNTKWQKNKAWTLKHIEKKRKYLKLKRTPEQLRAIKDKAIKSGVYVLGLEKTWKTRGACKEGDIVIWRNAQFATKFIKINGKFIIYSRHLWETNFGSIPNRMKVCMKQGLAEIKSINDLELLTPGQLSARNSQKASIGLSDNYIAGQLSNKNPALREAIKQHPELIHIKRQQLLLDRKIHQLNKQL